MTRGPGRRGRIATAAAVAVGCATAIVLIAEGDRANGGSGPAAEAAAGRWSSLARSHLARTEVGAARIDSNIYVVGGFAPPGGETSNQAVRYDIDRNAWSSIAPMPIGVNHPAVAALGGRLYVHGGYRDDASLSGETDALQAYDPVSETWATLAPSGSPRAAHVLVPVGGRLYAIGGAFLGKALTMVQIYDTATGSWSPAPGMKVPREHIAGAAVGKKILVLGGRDQGKNLSTVERFSTKTRRWRDLPPLLTPRSGFGAATVAGRVIAVGGEQLAEGTRTIGSVELYDLKKKRWRELAPMITPRHGLGVAARGRRVFALEGGPNPGLAFSDALEALRAPRAKRK